MKNYEEPEMEIIYFGAEDIITTSGVTDDDQGIFED